MRLGGKELAFKRVKGTTQRSRVITCREIEQDPPQNLPDDLVHKPDSEQSEDTLVKVPNSLAADENYWYRQ